MGDIIKTSKIGEIFMQSKFGIRELSAEHHWNDIDLTNFKTDKPLIVCLSGSGTMTTADANGFCKLAENLLGDRSQQAVIMGASYGVDEEKPRPYAAFSDEEVDEFAEKVLLSLCVDEKGEPYPLDKCCKNLSKVTFFTFCHGSTEVEKIIERLDDKLQSKGFTEEQISQANGSLIDINYDSECPSTSCPKIEFSPNSCAGGSMICKRIFDDEDVTLSSVMVVHDNPGHLGHGPVPYRRDCDQITFVSDSILKQRKKEVFDSFPQDMEHNVGYFKANSDGSLNENLSEQGKVLRQAMQMSLAARLENSIENSQADNYIPFDFKSLCVEAAKKLQICSAKQLIEETKQA